MRSPLVEHGSERLNSSGLTTAPLHAGRHLPGSRDLLPALRRRLWAIVVAAPQRQERAITGPQRLETDLAPPPKDVETARLELGAGLPRVGPGGSDFLDSDFRFLTVRGCAALAEAPLPPVGGCATRPRRRAGGCLATRHWCWGQARRPVDHAAFLRMCLGCSVKVLQARLPSSRADPARAALRANLLGLHCAVQAGRHPLWAKCRAHLVPLADPRADCVGRAGPDCCATRPGQDPG
jgi:hypothetical protein